MATAAVDKRRVILEAAVRVFARQGFHTCRVSDIADEAGVAYGLVYHYFGSKDEVLDTLFLERWEVMLELIREVDAEPLPVREKLANTCVHVGPDGEVKAVYRKVHMFDVEVGGRTYRESDLEDPGEEIVDSTTADGVRLGLSVCYDVRFPELYRILAVRGALVFPLPAAFTLATTRDHWETLLRARAIENQAFVVAANQIGEHPGGACSGGRSMIVDPWGIVLAQTPDGEGHVVAELDLLRLREVRERLPALANRRGDVYRWPQEVHA